MQFDADLDARQGRTVDGLGVVHFIAEDRQRIALHFQMRALDLLYQLRAPSNDWPPNP